MDLSEREIRIFHTTSRTNMQMHEMTGDSIIIFFSSRLRSKIDNTDW